MIFILFSDFVYLVSRTNFHTCMFMYLTRYVDTEEG